ncbi:MAG: SH3 domain-containing protein [Bacillota bacterium]
MKRKIISAVMIWMLLLTASSGVVAFGEESTRAFIIDRMANIYENPGGNANIITSISVGESVFVSGNEGKWLKISTEKGIHGWIDSRSVLIQDYSKHPIKEGIVNTEALNVNELPDIYSNITGILGFTSRVNVVGQDGTWFRVAIGEEIVGWVPSQFITVNTTPIYPKASVQVEKAKIKAESSSDSDTVIDVEKNSVILLKDYAEDYFHVILADGQEGWIHKYQMKTVRETIDEKNKSYFSKYVEQQNKKEDNMQGNNQTYEDFEDIKKMATFLGNDFTATAYDLSIASTGKAVGSKYRGFTRTGINLNGKQWGEAMVAAADPKVIPLGSKILVIFKPDDWRAKYNGIYLVGDTGGGVKGKTIDVYLGDGGNNQLEEVKNFGRAYDVEIYLVE